MPPRKRKPKIPLEPTEVIAEPISLKPEAPAEPLVEVRPISSHHQFKRPTAFRTIMVALVVGSLSSAVYFYREYQNAMLGKADTKEIASVVESLSEIVDLPSDEVPTFATVTDASKLTEQSFFARSQNGDKVLIYSKNGLAYLYRPESGKLINIAPIGNATVPAAPATVASNPTPSTQAVLGATTEAAGVPPEPAPSSTESVAEVAAPQTIRVALLNGSSKIGVTHTFESDFLAGDQEVAIIDKLPAARDDYQRTIVVDVTKKATAFAESLAQEAGTSVEQLPADEKVPGEADIVVIIGNDRN